MISKVLKEAGNLIETHQGIVTAILTVFGWFAVFWFGLRQQKKQMRHEAKMKVYEELFNLKKLVDEQSVPLGLLLNPFSVPFLIMEWTKKETDPIKANLKALEIWREYSMDLKEKTYSFGRAYLKFWTHAEMWLTLMPKLRKAKDELFVVQLNNLSKLLHAHQQYLIDLSVKEFYWEKWNRDDILKRTDDLSNKFNEIGIAYMEDFMGLIHNRLIKPIFGKKRYPREFFNPKGPVKCNVLTEDGIEETEVNYSQT